MSENVAPEEKSNLSGESVKVSREGKRRGELESEAGKTLGEGTFGKVKIAYHTLTKEKVAVKILEKERIQDDADVKRIINEIQILKVLHHPFLIQLYEIIETPKHLFLIMEYSPGGELFEYIVRETRLSEKEACRIFQQILWGVEYIHKLGIVHRDMKPENVILDANKNIKIIDFGLSNKYNEGDLLKTACGSPCYAAPEMIAGKRYVGLEVDIWSSGVVLFALLCGYLPFEDPNTNKLYKKIMDGDYTIPEFISPLAKDLLRKILNTDPRKRYKIEDIRRHPWFFIYRPKRIPVGILVNTQKLPVDEEVLEDLKELGFDPESSRSNIEINKHNSITTTYYLLLKRNRGYGKHSSADIHSDFFDPRTIKTKSGNNSSPIKRTLLTDEENGDHIVEKNASGLTDPTTNTSNLTNQNRSSLEKAEIKNKEPTDDYVQESQLDKDVDQSQKVVDEAEKQKDRQRHKFRLTTNLENPSPKQQLAPVQDRRRNRPPDTLGVDIQSPYDKKAELPSLQNKAPERIDKQSTRVPKSVTPSKKDSMQNFIQSMRGATTRRNEMINKSVDYSTPSERNNSIINTNVNNYFRETARRPALVLPERQKNSILDTNQVALNVNTPGKHTPSGSSTPSRHPLASRYGAPKMLDTSLVMNNPYDVVARPSHSTSPGSKHQVISFGGPKPPDTKKTKMAGMMNMISPNQKKVPTIRDQRRFKVRKDDNLSPPRPRNTHDLSYEEALNGSNALNNSNVQALTNNLITRVSKREKTDH